MSQIRIAVVGNCQVTGLGRCLEALSPNVQVVTSAVMPAGGGLLPREMHALTEADVVLVCNADRPEFQEQSFLDATSGAELIEVPVLAFRAFHPDTALVLADGVPVGNPWVSTWNSLALSWAYAQGWSVEQALTLFSDEVFENLGYLDYWDVSANALEFQFARLGFDFGTWIQAVQRTGVFMHGMNLGWSHRVRLPFRSSSAWVTINPCRWLRFLVTWRTRSGTPSGRSMHQSLTGWQWSAVRWFVGSGDSLAFRSLQPCALRPGVLRFRIRPCSPFRTINPRRRG